MAGAEFCGLIVYWSSMACEVVTAILLAVIAVGGGYSRSRVFLSQLQKKLKLSCRDWRVEQEEVNAPLPPLLSGMTLAYRFWYKKIDISLLFINHCSALTLET
jgi:hypothetical protein